MTNFSSSFIIFLNFPSSTFYRLGNLNLFLVRGHRCTSPTFSVIPKEFQKLLPNAIINETEWE